MKRKPSVKPLRRIVRDRFLMLWNVVMSFYVIVFMFHIFIHYGLSLSYDEFDIGCAPPFFESILTSPGLPPGESSDLFYGMMLLVFLFIVFQFPFSLGTYLRREMKHQKYRRSLRNSLLNLEQEDYHIGDDGEIVEVRQKGKLHG